VTYQKGKSSMHNICRSLKVDAKDVVRMQTSGQPLALLQILQRTKQHCFALEFVEAGMSSIAFQLPRKLPIQEITRQSPVKL
jgi:hypothetical protein